MLAGDPIGVPFNDWAFIEWGEKYGTKAPWGKVEFIALATALSRFESETIARGAWTNYLACDDPFYRGHSPRLFLASLGRWTPKVPRARRDKMQPDDIWKQKADALVRLHKEVNEDESIPELRKRDEVSRRFKEEFPQ